jgi:Leucine-rich repeat (LRR) protein
MNCNNFYLFQMTNLEGWLAYKKAEEIITDWIALNNPAATLDLSKLWLKELPPIPFNCQTFYCYENQLTMLPALPNCQSVSCYKNQLVSLPELPNCTELYCSYNQLKTLPKLPNCISMYCDNNKLKILPELPKCKKIWCFKNKLTMLPKLQQCEELWCSDNQLTYLPELHALANVYCNNNKYLWINKYQGKKYVGLNETPNYSKCAKVIQRNYKKYIIRKYKLLDKYLLKNTIKVVLLYI